MPVFSQELCGYYTSLSEMVEDYYTGDFALIVVMM